MNINPFKRITTLEAEMKAMRENYTTLLRDLPDFWARLAKVEKQMTAAMATASTNMDVMTKLPSIAAVEEAIGLATKFDGRLDRVRDRIDKNLGDQWAAINELDKQMDARMVGAGHLDKRLTALAEDVVLLKALRNVVTPEEASRKAINNQLPQDQAKLKRAWREAHPNITGYWGGLNNQLAQDQAKLEHERAKQREYNAAYRARQKAKAEAAARKEKRMDYQRAYRARKKAEQAAAQTTPGAAQ